MNMNSSTRSPDRVLRSDTSDTGCGLPFPIPLRMDTAVHQRDGVPGQLGAPAAEPGGDRPRRRGAGPAAAALLRARLPRQGDGDATPAAAEQRGRPGELD